MTFLPLLLFLASYLFASSSNILSVFPSTYSQYFDKSSSKVKTTLSEAFLLGEENQSIFSLSLWLKIIDLTSKGDIFIFEQDFQPRIYSDFYPNLEYSPPGVLTLNLICVELDNCPSTTINFTPSNNWIFLAFSASFKLKSSIFYYNDLGTEIYKSENYLFKFPIKFGSILWIGGDGSICARIGDVKFYNNIYNDAAEWNSIYLNSCAGVSCSNLHPSVCYAECDQWCKSESEWFLPILQPSLDTLTPYFNVLYSGYKINYDDIYFDVVVPTNGWSDYSITGWFEFPICHSDASTIFRLDDTWVALLDISLTASSSSNLCDTLKATIYNYNTLNYAFSSVSLNSLSYIGNWFFFAATINSGSKLLTLYAQNGSNPPSVSFPLISSSITYSYVAVPLTSSIRMFIGENDSYKLYPGNYADFRLYPGNHIDTTLVQYSNNIYSTATYLDPNCVLWESIWYCKTCKNGYFIKNGICQKCHPSCDNCSSNNTDKDCIGCAVGYYAQPGHPSICLNYCPYGYTWDSSLNQCTGTKGSILNINLDNNLSGNFIFFNIYIEFGIVIDYYPEYDILDPLPANKRGIYLDICQVRFTPQAPIQAGRLVSTDFTIEIWAMVLSTGVLYKSVVDRSFSTPDLLDSDKLVFPNIISDFSIAYDGSLEFSVNYLKIYQTSSQLITSFSSPEWSLYSLSLTYDNLSKTTQILMARNSDYYIGTIANYYRELNEILHYIGSVTGPIRGFVYNFAMYNYGKSYAEILLNLGTCSSCSACPAVLNYCLPTCDKTEYVNDNGKCQKCPSSCSGICSRAGTCNLCYDELCYKCSKYDIGTCSQCFENANLKNGQCECETGYIKQSSKCVNQCEDEYYLDLKAQSCLSCPENCLNCNNGNSCTICKNDFVLQNGVCKCPEQYFINASNECSKCSNSCLTCSVIPSNCTSCLQSAPILYQFYKCYPCSAFEGYSSSFIISAEYFTDNLLSQLLSHCIEICGDGRNMGQAQCDDGNKINGDGCSSNCTVENGWSCFGGSINSPDICKDAVPPSPILSYLNENSSGYLLALSFSEAVIFIEEISKNIKIEIDGITKFSWSISAENSLYVITLEIYENVASGTTVIVYFIDPSLVTDVHGNEMQVSYTKTQLASSFTYQLGQLMESSVITITTSAVAGAVIGSMTSGFTLGVFNLQALWGMIEMMQMQYYLIFLSPKYPDNLLSYISALSISNGNFLPNPFQKYLIKKDPFPDPPQRFLEESFNTDFIMNAGQFLLVWSLILAGLPISLLLFKRFPTVSIIRWLKNSYLFSILLRIGIESFLEITLSVFLQWREISEPNQSVGYLSLALSFITMAYLILTFALIIWQITLKSEEELTTNSHKRKFGTLYEGFKHNSKLAASFLLFQNLRRLLFVIYCVFLHEFTATQVALSNILSFVYTISLILLRPFNSNILGNGLHISSELLYFSAHCMILKFLDDSLSDNDRIELGWLVIAVLGFSLLLHVIALFIIQIISLVRGCKHLKNSFMKNFSNKFAYRGRSIILDNKASPKSEKENEMDENEGYFGRKKKQKEAKEETWTFRKTKIVPKDESFNTDTMGDESFVEK